MPLSKTQINYLTDKLRNETRTAQESFRKQNPCEYTQDECVAALKAAGFVVKDRYSAKYITPVLTPAMQANLDKIDTFNKASNAALSEAIDTINLGGADEALALLRDFTAKLAELAR